MKTYSTKANANRAAKTAGLEAGKFNVLEIDGRFILEVIKTDLFDEAAADAEYEALQKRQAEIASEAVEAKAKWLEEMIPYNPQLLLSYTPVVSNINQVKSSSAKKPVKLVWEIADKMWGEPRKDIIAACVAAGIAYNTARTQYQAFYSIKSKEAKPE